MSANERRDFYQAYINELVDSLERTSGGHASPRDSKLINYVNSNGFIQFWYHDIWLGGVWYPLSDRGRKLSNLAVNSFYKTTLDFIALAQHQFARYMRSHPK